MSIVGFLRETIANREPWTDRALCAQSDPECWFPEKGGSVMDAKKVCFNCPVRLECLQYALDHDERFGVWGGATERERRRLKRARADRAPARSRPVAAVPTHGTRSTYRKGCRCRFCTSVETEYQRLRYQRRGSGGGAKDGVA